MVLSKKETIVAKAKRIKEFFKKLGVVKTRETVGVGTLKLVEKSSHIDRHYFNGCKENLLFFKILGIEYRYPGTHVPRFGSKCKP